MDFFEKIFQSGAQYLKKRKLAASQERGARFDDHFLTLSTLASAAAGRSLELRAADGHGYLKPELLVLPQLIDHFPTPENNLFCLFHQALMGGALSALLEAGQSCSDRHALEHLGREFPGFSRWRELGLEAVGAQLSLEPAEMGKWLSPALRSGTRKSIRAYQPSSRGRNLQQTEKAAKKPGEVSTVDLDQERAKNNPVTHSFEKMETADEYRGGHRISDGSDQLEEHSAALEELNLSQVTRSGERSESIYRAEVADLLESEEQELGAARSSEFLWYPEWNYRRRELRARHCRLYVQKSSPKSGELHWIDGVREKYSTELLRWEQQWLGLANQRRWRGRQWDGEEVDIDAYVRYASDLRSTGSGDARVFLKRMPSERNLATLILLDQSYSTDSFVETRRVLDVELESIGLAGMLQEKIGDPVAVAGTWSETRSHCHFSWYKGFEEPWARFYEWAPAIEPRGYTRLGPAIRHSIEELARTRVRTKLLVLLTDGKPTDYDQYEGRYGIEDIHHSILEARQQGVEVRALAIEKDAKHYFPALFGARNYQILSTPAQLPEALFRLYLEAIML